MPIRERLLRAVRFAEAEEQIPRSTIRTNRRAPPLRRQNQYFKVREKLPVDPVAVARRVHVPVWTGRVALMV